MRRGGGVGGGVGEGRGGGGHQGVCWEGVVEACYLFLVGMVVEGVVVVSGLGAVWWLGVGGVVAVGMGFVVVVGAGAGVFIVGGGVWRVVAVGWVVG